MHHHRHVVSSTSELNAAIIVHLRSNRLVDAVLAFTDSPPHLRNTTTHNLLLAAYTSRGLLSGAVQLFEEMPRRDAVSYNTLLRSCGPHQALQLLRRMLRSSVGPTGPTLSTVLPSLPDPKLAAQVHVIAARSGLSSNPFVGSALIAAYATLKDPDSVRKAFDEIEIKNAVTWTSVINGLMDLNRAGEARQAFDKMPLKTAEAYTALINGYIKNGDIKSARKLFDDPAAERNVATWTAMINGYTKTRRFREGLTLFARMDGAAHVSPNPFTYAAALTCASGLASPTAGGPLHARVAKLGLSDHVLSTCLVEMYGRCGDASSSIRAFEGSGPGARNVATWNAVIGSCGKNSRPDKAAEFFGRMLTEGNGARPDGITFVNLLAACAHGGLVEEGERLFERMEGEFGVRRGVEHYGCLIDMYARAGMAEAAEKVVETMPMAADVAALGLGFERRIRVLGERGEWGRAGELKEERERVVGRRKGAGISLVELSTGGG